MRVNIYGISTTVDHETDESLITLVMRIRETEAVLML